MTWSPWTGLPQTVKLSPAFNSLPAWQHCVVGQPAALVKWLSQRMGLSRERSGGALRCCIECARACWWSGSSEEVLLKREVWGNSGGRVGVCSNGRDARSAGTRLGKGRENIWRLPEVGCVESWADF